MCDVFKTTNSFILVDLKGGEKPSLRQQIIDQSLKDLEDSSVIPVNLDKIEWFKKSQHNGKSVKYIAIGTDQNGKKWFANITVGHKESFVEIRSFGPLEVPCSQEEINFSAVPACVTKLMNRLFTVRLLSPVENRLNILFEE